MKLMFAHGAKRHPDLFSAMWRGSYANSRALKFFATRDDQGEFVFVSEDECLPLTGDEVFDPSPYWLGDEASDWMADPITAPWLEALEPDDEPEGSPTWGTTFDPADVQWGFSVRTRA